MPAATTAKLQEELDFFERHRLELLERAPGKYALIKGSEVIGVFDTEIEAARTGYRQIGNEPFLIKHIVEADVPLIFTSFNLGVSAVIPSVSRGIRVGGRRATRAPRSLD